VHQVLRQAGRQAQVHGIPREGSPVRTLRFPSLRHPLTVKCTVSFISRTGPTPSRPPSFSALFPSATPTVLTSSRPTRSSAPLSPRLVRRLLRPTKRRPASLESARLTSPRGRGPSSRNSLNSSSEGFEVRFHALLFLTIFSTDTYIRTDSPALYLTSNIPSPCSHSQTRISTPSRSQPPVLPVLSFFPATRSLSTELCSNLLCEAVSLSSLAPSAAAFTW
jgi:hypothetical protein